MSTKYKLIDYKESRFTGLIRTILAYAGQEFEDLRIPKAEAQVLEKDVPFGTLPALEENGQVVAIQGEIARYLANRHGLAGKSPEEAANCNTVMEGLRMLYQPLAYSLKGKPGEEKAELSKLYFREKGVKYLQHFDKLLKEHEEWDYFVSNEVTWCDLGVASLCAWLMTRNASILDCCPSLKAFTEKMSDQPVIKAVIKKVSETATA